jgi:hypothetical protein
VRVTAKPYVVFRLTGLKNHESSLWMLPGKAQTLTPHGVETVNTGDTIQIAGVTAHVFVPPSKLDEWKKANAE